MALLGRNLRPRVAAPISPSIGIVVVVAYVAASAFGTDQGRPLRSVAFGLLALLLALGTARLKRPVAMTALGGVAVSVATLGAAGPHPLGDLFGAGAALASTLAALYACAHLEAPMALAVCSRRTPWLGVALAVVAWSLPALSAVAAAFGRAAALGRSGAWWGAMASLASLGVLLALLADVYRRRRLELGVATRSVASLAAVLVAASLAVYLARRHVEAPARIGRCAVALGAAAVTWLALYADPIRIARGGRRLVAVTALGAAVALVGAVAVARVPSWAGPVVAAAAFIAAAAGTLGQQRLEAPLRPGRGRWLDAVCSARRQLSHLDPDESICQVLLALRAPVGIAGPSPQLWTFDPGRVASIDVAGYLHGRAAELPARLLELAVSEPFATLRIEVLTSSQVRRPELRPALRWMTDHHAMLATAVVRDGEPVGLLVLPPFKGHGGMSIEELSAIKDLADALVPVCHERSMLARSLAREQHLAERVDAAQSQLARLQGDVALRSGRHAHLIAYLARPATVGIYAWASRRALEALEQKTSSSAPIAVVAPSGVDPVPYLARAHLAGRRRAGPLVLVDGTDGREHDEGHWRDPRGSPLTLADGGMLVLLDGAALPVTVQQWIARALTEPWRLWDRVESLDVQLALTGTLSPGELVHAERLDRSLASRLGDEGAHPIMLPRLRDRAEDVRALVTDRIAREGLRVRGVPMGIEPAAMARLLEYPFPGDDAELDYIVYRLVACSTTHRIRFADLDALGLAACESLLCGDRGPRTA